MSDKSLNNQQRHIITTLTSRCSESEPGFVQILSGPRQVGKTTVLIELQRHLGDRAVYVAADSPESSHPGWWETLWAGVEQNAAADKAVLIIDEIHLLPEWSRLVKAQHDRMLRLKIPIQLVVSGSSSLLLGKGSREAMTGRFELLRMPHWSAKNLSDSFALDPATAAELTLEMGTFPGAVRLMQDRQRWRAYIRDSIIEPSIGKDIIMLEHVRKPAILRQLFAIAMSHPAEIIALHKLCAGLTEKGSIATAAHYLNLLQEASLVASVPKFSPNIIRQRSSPPKLIALNQAYLGATIGDSALPLSQDPIRFGRWVENACMAHAWNTGQTIYYWREEPYEVDMIINGTWGKLAIEIKTGLATASDLKGLFEFMSRNPDFRALVVCEKQRIEPLRASGVNAMAWQDFLLNGP